jgi:hypothetical protein
MAWVPSDDLLRWMAFMACASLIALVPLVAFRTPAVIGRVIGVLEEIRDLLKQKK